MDAMRRVYAAGDPDLQIKRGGDHPGPEIRGRDGVQKNFFSALWTSVWSKNRGGGPPGPSPGSTIGMND